MPQQISTADGQRLAIATLGTGPDLLCVPGGPGRAVAYLGDLGGLDASRTLVLADPRGSGGSRPAEPAGLTLTNLVSDLGTLAASRALASPAVLAHSFGCRVAVGYAAAHPVRALVLITPPVPGDEQLANAGRATIFDQRSSEPGMAEAVEAARALNGARPRDRSLLRSMTTPLWYGRWDTAARAHAALMGEQTPARTALTLGDSARAAGLPDLSVLDMPALVVAGELDMISPPDAVHALAKQVPQSMFAMIEGAGHFPWLDEPAAFAALVVDFLDGAGVPS